MESYRGGNGWSARSKHPCTHECEQPKYAHVDAQTDPLVHVLGGEWVKRRLHKTVWHAIGQHAYEIDVVTGSRYADAKGVTRKKPMSRIVGIVGPDGPGDLCTGLSIEDLNLLYEARCHVNRQRESWQTVFI